MNNQKEELYMSYKPLQNDSCNAYYLPVRCQVQWLHFGKSRKQLKCLLILKYVRDASEIKAIKLSICCLLLILFSFLIKIGEFSFIQNGGTDIQGISLLELH